MAGVDLPAPLVPPEVDIRGFSGFMLDVDRLLASELVALATPEEGWHAFMLWCRAWQQHPAGSLPNDERVLAAFSKAGPRWKKVREMALRGFVLCSDGRLYHPVVVEQVMTAWAKRKAYQNDQARLKNWREQRRANASTNAKETPHETPHETQSETDLKRVSKRVREPYRQGQGQGQKESKQATRASPPMPTLNDDPAAWLHLTTTSELCRDDGKPHATAGGWYVDTAAALVCEAARMDGHSPGVDWGPMLGWLSDGIDLHAQILPAIKDIAARPTYKPPRFLSYFDNAVRTQRAA